MPRNRKGKVIPSSGNISADTRLPNAEELQAKARRIAAARNLSAQETENFFAERRARADDEAFLRILNRKGGEPPRPEDSID